MTIDIMKVLVERTKDTDKIIEKYIPRKYTEKDMEILAGKPRYKYNTEASTLSISKPIWDLLDRGGKRWRPAMMLMIIDALGKKSSDYKDFSIIPEIIHNATIVHDDIEDNSETRREKPCLHKIYGDDIAINVGDGMFFLPIKVFMKHKDKLTKEQMIKLYEIYTQEMINVCLGQGMDISWHKGHANADKITEEEYLQMCAYKTGCLARMSAKIGACVSGASDETIEKLGSLAEAIGVAFQIQDDVLNLIGEEFKKGKGGVGEDIHEGKRTLMVVHTLNNASEKERKRLLEILNMHTWDSNLINEAIAIMKKYNAFDHAKTRAKKILENAWKDAENLLNNSPAKQELEAFAHFLIDRKI